MRSSFDYAVLRVVPSVERGELVNVGVVVLCLEQRFLGSRVMVDEARLKGIWPELDVPLVRRHLKAIQRICLGDAESGPIARLSLRERFHWIVSPKSTMIQVSPVHSGICEYPVEDLDHLARLFVVGYDEGCERVEAASSVGA